MKALLLPRRRTDRSRRCPEDRFLAFCARSRLPKPQCNVKVCGLEVDALFANEKVIVELDSWGFHSSRESFEDDRERDTVTTAAGFVTVRITWRGFEPQAQRLLGILAARRRHGRPSAARRAAPGGGQ